MKHRLLRAALIPAALLLSACVTTGSFPGFGSGKNTAVGPGSIEKDAAAAPAGLSADAPRLDVVIPVFDPGLPQDPDDYAEHNVWPELRRAEANRFALQMKRALEKTGVFGAVRVTPDKTAIGDLYILGAIEESNGEDVEMRIEAVAMSGRRWHAETYEHRIKEAFYQDVRNKGKDPYAPMFAEAAADIAALLRNKPGGELARLQSITEMRFAASLSPGAFSGHLKRSGGTFTLASLPAETDPMLARTRALRVRDQLFVDRLQAHYEDFSTRMDKSYSVWQKESFQEVQMARAANRKSWMEALGGALIIGLSVAAAVSSDNPNTGDVAQVGAAAGGLLIAKSFQTRAEMKVHREALAELGESIHAELAPAVMEFENKTVELTGTAEEQFAQWRSYLKRIYEQEATPEVRI